MIFTRGVLTCHHLLELIEERAVLTLAASALLDGFPDHQAEEVGRRGLSLRLPRLLELAEEVPRVVLHLFGQRVLLDEAFRQDGRLT
jgi:hypothetical protein